MTQGTKPQSGANPAYARALALLKKNDAASQTRIGGYMPLHKAMDQAYEAEAQGHDKNLGLSIQQAGMLNSIRGY